jgi:hypothetical protein
MKKLLLICAAVVLMAGSAYAASQWNFYGSARVTTFYTDVHKSGPDSDTFDMGLQSESNIGASVHASDIVSGGFEYGADGGNADLRHLYGIWNFGAGSLLIGQTDCPLRLPGSDQAYNNDAGLGGWGEMSSPRRAQIKLIMGDFRIAMVAPNASYNNGTTNVSTNTETRIPAIEAKYNFSNDNYSIGLTAGYSTFKVGATTQQSIDSYVIGIGADFTAGPFVFGGDVFGGRNVGNLIDADVNGADTGAGLARYNGTRVTDNDARAWKVHVTYTFNDTFSAQAGYGYMQTELKGQNEDKVQVYYLQVPVQLAPGVSIVPEIGCIDYWESSQDTTNYFGAKWQIDF